MPRTCHLFFQGHGAIIRKFLTSSQLQISPPTLESTRFRLCVLDSLYLTATHVKYKLWNKVKFHSSIFQSLNNTELWCRYPSCESTGHGGELLLRLQNRWSCLYTCMWIDGFLGALTLQSTDVFLYHIVETFECNPNQLSFFGCRERALPRKASADSVLRQKEQTFDQHGLPFITESYWRGGFQKLAQGWPTPYIARCVSRWWYRKIHEVS